MFVATKHVFCKLVAKKKKKKKSHEFLFVVATNNIIKLSRVCGYKTFVATKIMLVAAPAND